MTEIDIYIDADGIQAVYSDDLAEMFDGEHQVTHRASHVEPSLVRIFGQCGWVADMSPVGGPVLTDGDRPFKTRQAALDAEREWLDRQLSERRLEAK